MSEMEAIKVDAPQAPVEQAVPPVSNGTEKKPFSWLNPHHVFVVILVGEEQQPFGIQKDFLCDRSEYFKNYQFDQQEQTVEHLIKFPNTTVQVFGLAQKFLYTGAISTDDNQSPSYENLVGLWRLGHFLGIAGLCETTLAAMKECRRTTQRIPSTPLLIQVWKDTPEGSDIRKLLLSWAAEYMRSSTARAEFAKSLPQEVLSELVVTMSLLDDLPPEEPPAPPPPSNLPANGARKNVHYLDEQSDEETLNNIKRNRMSAGALPGAGGLLGSQLAAGRKPPRASLPKLQKRRTSGHLAADPRTFTTAQKMDFCADLLTRMLSGPGFWTRLVGPFKEPVVPEEDGVPDYFNKVKKPMDLSTIKGKMDRREYKNEEEFLSDMRQIFENCFLYWKKGDPMWLAGEKLQKTFEDKFSGMNKWIAKMGGDEGDA